MTDLHLHLDGSLTLPAVRHLATLQHIDIPEEDAQLRQHLTVSPDCHNLNEYLEKFDFPCQLLQTREAITFAVANLLKELQSSGLSDAEIRFAPQKHTDQGLSQEAVVQAALAGLHQSTMPASLILCCMRGNDNEAANLETLQVASQYLHQGVCAADLAGAEALFPTHQFTTLFAEARNLNVPFTIHAGEADGPRSVWDAIEMGARRIGHGVRSIEDRELLRRLAKDAIPLELCPTSNLQTCVFPSLEQYPLLQLLDAGITVTVNTDNMTVSGTTLQHEFDILANTFRLSEGDIQLLKQNAQQATFVN